MSNSRIVPDNLAEQLRDLHAPSFPRDHNSPTIDARPTTSAKQGTPDKLVRPLRDFPDFRTREQWEDDPAASIQKERHVDKLGMVVRSYVIIFACAWEWEELTWVTAIDAMRERHDIADAFLSFGYGIGTWGTEQACRVETSTPADIVPFVQAFLEWYAQECAYVSIDGVGYLIDVAGVVSPIT